MKATMRRLAGAAAVLLACSLPVSAFQANRPGAIEGRVVNAVSGDAVRRVNLTLTAIHGNAKPATAQTDENGRFAFRDLAPGGYRLAGERGGFQRQAYGARLNPNSGAVLALAPGEVIQDLTFRLSPDAVISGQVLDQEGEPMPNLLVSVLKNAYANGRRQWISSGAMQTNDRGEFRIAGLRAGRYIVIATDMNIGIGLAGVSKDAPPDKPETTYASTYYGNTTELARAAPIDLRTGDDRRGAHIQMVKSTTVRVRGKVVDAPEGKIMMVMLVPKGIGTGQAPGRLGLVQANDQTFEIKGVSPGSYLLTARAATEAARAAGAMPLEVADRPIDGLAFRLGAGGELSGRVVIQGDPAPGLKDVNVTFENLDFQLGEAPNARAGEDGRFTLKDVIAGRYRVRVRGLPDNSYVKSVKLGGREADESAVEVAAGAQLEIALGAGGALVEGTVVGPDEKPMRGATVALIPDSRRESRYATAAADEKGAFRIPGIAPGKYKLLAWEDIEQGSWLDAEFVKPFESRAEALSLEENGRSKVVLKAIPFEPVPGAPR